MRSTGRTKEGIWSKRETHTSIVDIERRYCEKCDTSGFVRDRGTVFGSRDSVPTVRRQVVVSGRNRVRIMDRTSTVTYRHNCCVTST